MASATQKDGMFWSLVSWGGGIVAFLLVYALVRALFGGTVPDGLVFGGVAFILVAAILTARLGPKEAPLRHAHAVHTAATPALGATTHAPTRVTHANDPTEDPGSLAAPAAPAADLTGTRSERVSEAAREAARLAVELDAPPAASPAALDAPRGGKPAQRADRGEA